jgi:hypothetical protein
MPRHQDDAERRDALIAALNAAQGEVITTRNALAKAMTERKTIVQELFRLYDPAPIRAMEEATQMDKGRLYQIRDNRHGNEGSRRRAG